MKHGAKMVVVLLASGLVLLVGCGAGSTTAGGGAGSGGTCDPGPISSTPGGSNAFSSGDIAAAKKADCLVVIYCHGVDSEAQRVGCLSHVTDGDVCPQNTEDRRYAVTAYIQATGDDAVCD